MVERGGRLFGERELPVAIGRYRVTQRIGAGGMGVVYGAHDPELDREVAIKVVRSTARTEVASTARLIREAQAMARLTHPNVMPVYDVGRHGDEVFVAMPYIEGETLDQWQRRRPQPWKDVVDVYSKAGRGLAAAHAAGLVHRDFKPANVMLAKDGRVLVMDFGLVTGRSEGEVGATLAEDSLAEDAVRSADHLWDGLTHTGQVVGTPSYMAPEQQLGKVTGAAADQFSFCAALSEGLIGEPPFEGSSPAELAASKARGALIPFPTSAGVPRRVREALRRGLRPRPEHRWPAMEALLGELERARTGRTRRWLGLSAVLVGLVGVGLAWSRPVDPMAARGCSGDGETLASWTDDRRQQVREAMIRSDPVYAGGMADHVVDSLDQYARRFAQAKQTACATDQAGSELASLRDEAHQCLAERRLRFDTLVDALIDADTDVVDASLQTMTGLSPAERCLEPGWLSSEVAPPPSAEVAVAADALRNQIVAGWALGGVGRTREGREMLEHTLRDAKELGYEPLVVEAELALANVLMGERDLDVAIEAQERAYFRASGVGHYQVVLDAAGNLAHLHGVKRSDPETAWTWIRHAESALVELGHDPIERARLDLTIGNLHLLQGKHARANQAFERGLETLQDAGPVFRLDVSRCLQNLGVVAESTGRFAEAVDYQRRAVRIVEETTGTDHPLWTHSINNLANALHRAGEREEALRWHREALEARKRIFGETHPEVAMSLTNLGVLLMEKGDLQEAVATQRDSVNVWLELGETDHLWMGVSRLNLATGLGRLERHQDALRELTEAERIFEQTLPSEHPYWIYLLKERSIAYEAQGNQEAAREHLDEALVSCKRRPEHGEGACIEVQILLAEMLRGVDAQRVEALVRSASADFERLDFHDDDLRQRLAALSR